MHAEPPLDPAWMREDHTCDYDILFVSCTYLHDLASLLLRALLSSESIFLLLICYIWSLDVIDAVHAFHRICRTEITFFSHIPTAQENLNKVGARQAHSRGVSVARKPPKCFAFFSFMVLAGGNASQVLPSAILNGSGWYFWVFRRCIISIFPPPDPCTPIFKVWIRLCYWSLPQYKL